MVGTTKHPRQARMRGHGMKVRIARSGLLPEVPLRGISPFQPIQLIAPIQEETPLPWHDLGPIDTSLELLYPDRASDPECPVPKSETLLTEHQQLYMQWIEKITDLDRRFCKDPRLYCAYCDMNIHPRFACKHARKHQKERARHRCTLCSALHAPFQCPLAQVNGGKGKPNWARVEYKRARDDGREPDLRWGENADQAPSQETPERTPREDQQPMCAAAVMMHSRSARGASSSWQGGCPPIDEQREWAPQAPVHDVI